MALVYGPGLALYLYAGELLKFGASHTLPADEAVSAEHYFVCLWADAREGLWTPLHVTRGMDRLPLPASAKAGHPRFASGLSYYSTAELWRIPHKAVQRAAAAAGDKSGEKNPNRVAPHWIPERAQFPAEVPDKPVGR